MLLIPSVFVICSLFIGASVSEPTNIERVRSLENLHRSVRSYIENLSKVEDEKGFEAFQERTEFKSFNNQPSFLNQLALDLLDKKFPDAEAEKSAVEKATSTWKEKAMGAIVECINNANSLIENEAAKGKNIKAKIVDVTKKAMDDINANTRIDKEDRKSSCPIYEKLKDIISTYGGEDDLAEFERKNKVEG